MVLVGHTGTEKGHTMFVTATVILAAFVPVGEGAPLYEVEVGVEEDFDKTSVEMAEDVAEALFRATNLNEGPLWERITKVLPQGRTHTAISVGDLVEVGDIVLLCSPLGWSVMHPNRPSLLGQDAYPTTKF